jgi:hypothetical protein
VVFIVLAIASCVALAGCASPGDAPNDCIHKTFGCDMSGRPL